MTPLDRNSFLQSKRFEVEKLKSRLAALDEMKLRLDENMRQLDQAADREQMRSGDSNLARLAMPRILQAMEERRKNIEKSRTDLEQDRNLLEAELVAAIEELGAAELADEQRKRHAAKAAASLPALKREQSLMRRHLRRHAGP